MKKTRKEDDEKLDLNLLKTNFKRTWKFLKYEKRNIFIYIMIMIVQITLGIILPLISTRIILNITDGAFLQLILTSAIILLIDFIEEIMSYVSNYCYQHITDYSSNRIQILFAKEFLKLEVQEIDKSSTGAFMERINYDTGTLSYVFIRMFSTISSMLTKIGTMITVFILNRYIFIYYVLVAIINLLLGEYANRIRERYYKRIRILNEEKSSFISEMVRGIRDIKVLNAIEPVSKKAEERMSSVTDESFKLGRTSSKFYMINGFITSTTDFLFLVLGVVLCSHNLLNIPTFLILYNYRGRISFLFNSISDLLGTLREYNISAKRVYEIIYGEGFKKETFGNKKIKKVKGHLVFQNVNFSYDGKKKVIDNMNFEIKPNETVGFVGKSGAGKSTIFSLITKLYNITDGEIIIDGININALDRDSLRNNMSIITQNPYIFNFSIKDNLLLANPKASMKEIRNACKMACIDDYIMSLDEKYETKLGEGGLILSGGQKQRLAIARALLMKTEFILLDEATSSLDNETQSEIQDAIRNLKGSYTILIIAHRLSTVIESDKIMVVDKGKIIDVGTHEELLKKSSIYKKLYKN